jgi:hypothetical protein
MVIAKLMLTRISLGNNQVKAEADGLGEENVTKQNSALKGCAKSICAKVWLWMVTVATT